MAVSIRDVANATGVSVSTVSRALNGYSDVNKETQQKIAAGIGIAAFVIAIVVLIEIARTPMPL